MSDNDYDSFDYKSSQDFFEVDYQIDLFEYRQSFKFKKNKQKSYPISVKTLKSQPIFVKTNCMGYKKTSKAKQKSFRSKRNSRKSKYFECDKLFHLTTACALPHSLKELNDEHVHSFSKFRRHFYYVNRCLIRSSLKNHSDIKIVNVRLAPVNKSVQNEFMKRLNEDPSYVPHLVYHGTKLTTIESILRYGFLIPNQAHPSNNKAPIIKSENGQAFGIGIYCSYTATYSLSYSNTTNTLLVCAALPKCDEVGNVQHCHGNILVLSHVSQIIPLFLIDFRYLNQSGINCPHYNKQKQLQIDENKERKKHVIIPKKYLQKILNRMNDQVQNNNRYQLRVFDPNE